MNESPAASPRAAKKTSPPRAGGKPGKTSAADAAARKDNPEHATPAEENPAENNNSENAKTPKPRTQRPRKRAKPQKSPADPASVPDLSSQPVLQAPPLTETVPESAPGSAEIALAEASTLKNKRSAKTSATGRSRRPGASRQSGSAKKNGTAATDESTEQAEVPPGKLPRNTAQASPANPREEEFPPAQPDPRTDWQAPEERLPDAAEPEELSASAGVEPEKENEPADKPSERADKTAPGKKRKPSSKKPAGQDNTPRIASAGEQAKAKRKMLVSVLPGEQVEVVIAENGLVQEYYIELLHQAKIKGNIYKGIIHNVDPNLQAAFVAYGAAKNGFLQIDEVHPEYYLAPHETAKAHKYPLIQKVLKPGQEILVQVVKEPSGTKGAFLTSYLSLPGRFLVLTPGNEQIGVSRKVESEEERTRLRELLSGLNPGEGLGVIVRTVSAGTTKTNLQRDLQQLKRVWKEVRKKGSTELAPSLIYQEMALDTRAVRDYLTEEITELWVDDEEMAVQIRELVTLLFPKRENVVHLHTDLEHTLFEHFNLKKQLEQVHSREVTLPSGGRLVFDHTEALMAVDINSGRAVGKNNFEDTAYKTNLEAAQQIPLQLRLRDIGGQVVIDFIEMRDRSHWRDLEKAVRNGMKGDRARHDIGKISSFGLLEIVRQRLSSSAISVTSEPCPCCKGTGQRRNMEWQALQALREIRSLLRKQSESGASTAVYSNLPELVLYLLNQKKERLLEMEKSFGVKLELKLGVK
ncbi:MAG: Rne/Rng family ribonuclease [Deltaproteobacteria bacterium]|jgi:ribonuclease E|nr:Rne/Rng family ribonuclease [Deltaproteobacteria bacterium]